MNESYDFKSIKVDGKRCIFRDVAEYNDTDFVARYKGYDLEVYLDADRFAPEEQRYYALVRNPDIFLGTVVDGFLGEEVDNIHDAIVQALKDARLV